MSKASAERSKTFSGGQKLQLSSASTGEKPQTTPTGEKSQTAPTSFIPSTVRPPVGKCTHCDIKVKGQAPVVVAENVYPVPITSIFDNFFNEESDKCDIWDEFYTTEPTFEPYKDNYKMSQWALSSEKCCLERKTSATTPPTNLGFGLGSSSTNIIQHHRAFFLSDNLFVYTTKSRALEVPYCDAFTVDTLWTFERKGANIFVRVVADIFFTKNPMVKAIITRTAMGPAEANLRLTFSVFERFSKDPIITARNGLIDASPPSEQFAKFTKEGKISRSTSVAAIKRKSSVISIHTPQFDTAAFDMEEKEPDSWNPRARYMDDDTLLTILGVCGLLLCSAFAYVCTSISSLHDHQQLILYELARSGGLLAALLEGNESAAKLWKETPQNSLVKILDFYHQNAKLSHTYLTTYNENIMLLDSVIQGGQEWGYFASLLYYLGYTCAFFFTATAFFLLYQKVS